jgi:molybdate/tungstate transport system permease protein
MRNKPADIIQAAALFIAASVCFFVIIGPVAGMILNTSASTIAKSLFDPEVTRSILLTFECAFYSTIFAFIFGTPLAYLLSRKSLPFSGIIEAVVDIPVMIPHTAAGIALLVVFAGGPLGGFFSAAGIEFMGTKAGIVLGMTFVSIPFYVNSAKEGFRAIDPRLEYSARSLGASRFQVFTKILMPLAAGPMLTGAAMMWGRGISEFGAVVILAYHPMIAPVLIYDRYTSYGLDYSRPAAVLLIIMSLIVFALFKFIANMRFGRHAENKRDK